MRFSIVFATRERTTLLRNLLESIVVTTHNPRWIEVIAVYDSDDSETDGISSELIEKFKSINLRMLRRERSPRLNEDYINYAARLSDGEYIIVLNDDVKFETQGWDDVAYQKCEDYKITYPDGIMYGVTEDGLNDLKRRQNLTYCCFPLISKKAVKILGYAMHPAFNSWGADVHLYRIYSNINRVVDLRDIKLIHYSYHGNSREKDKVNEHVRQIDNGVHPCSFGINGECVKLQSEMK